VPGTMSGTAGKGAGAGAPCEGAAAGAPALTDALMTGAEYIESLRDGRTVYYDGEAIRDVTTHPTSRNAVRSIAMLYDALHDPATRDVLTMVDRHGIRTHRFFTASYSPAELLAARDAIRCWSRMNYGVMGRTPDYKAAFMATLGANPEFYAPWTENGRAWYRRYASRGLFLNHVLVNPPVDRKKPVHEVGDVFVHVVRETDGGIIVSGAKMLATGSALTHATFVAQNSAANLQAGHAEDFALVFIAPMDTPGCKLILRPSYEAAARSPFDAPLASRFDENDAVLVFDNAFIAWENVLVYRDVERARRMYAASGFMNRYNLQAGTRLGVKLDLMCGLLEKGLAANGTDEFRGTQAMLGELIGWRNMIWALTSAMCLDPQPGPGDTVMPKLEYASAMRMFSTMAWPRLKDLFETALGGAPIVTPSSWRDLRSPQVRPLLDQYYRGSDGSAEQRIKLFKLIWDAIGTEFGGRHEIYERNYSGNNEQVRLDLLTFARGRGIMDECRALAERCMDDYDLDGWRSPVWR